MIGSIGVGPDCPRLEGAGCCALTTILIQSVARPLYAHRGATWPRKMSIRSLPGDSLRRVLAVAQMSLDFLGIGASAA